MEFGPVKASTMAMVSVPPVLLLFPPVLELHAVMVSANATASTSALA
jgi:hypothetical protein